jgi:tRNA (cytidine/uridine-2'-O-)-methyltransferase
MAKDHLPRLRADPHPQPPHIVLVEPEIPQNTGNIARLAGALGCPLHLVGKLGFRIDEKAVRRAGVDYWHLVDIRRHDDLGAFELAQPDARQLLFSAVARQSYLAAEFRPGDALLFGRESRGLDEALLARHPERCFALPTIGAVRSLNLANSVAVVAYEAMRQLGAFDRVYSEDSVYSEEVDDHSAAGASDTNSR